ncbi:MAG: HEPN domain-containing protein [Candidatus Rokubacteria bacterium]|nr:HEPN domain-containing protein [Candidatus Rokubacteria bacterium]
MNLLRRYEELLDRFVVELKATYGSRLVACAVFGSVGRGTPRVGSDIDLLIVARGLPRGRFNRVEEFLGVEARLESALTATESGSPPIALSPVFKSPEEVEAGSPLFLDLVEDARILYDPEHCLTGYLDRLRARLRALGARRHRRGNAWYWELKPDLKPGEVFVGYLIKAQKRLKALAVLRDEGAHSDVVREAQELVELALKGMLRAVGIEPPKFHDVGGLLLEHEVKFSPELRARLPRAAEISKRLRRERELALYGDIDFIPTEAYSTADAECAYADAAWVLTVASEVIDRLPS